MARICPFLAVESDGRTAVAGYDADHRCFALEAPDQLSRSQQLSVCLEQAHVSCERYAAAVQRQPAEAAWERPAPDAEIVSTRLTISPELGLRRLPGAGSGPGLRRWAVGGALALVGVISVAGGVTGVLGSLRGNYGDAVASDEPSATTRPVAAVATARPSGSAVRTPRPSPSAAVAATPRPTAQPTPRRTSTPESRQQTYVVQAGDTLNAIATSFGTSVEAIQQANGLGSSEVILVGQVLVIP